MRFLKVLIFILGILMISQNVTAQVATSAVPFLLIAPSSRNAGMGEAGAGIADDAWAQFWNPGGLAFQTGSEISISHANWLPQLGLGDLWIAHMIYKEEMKSLDGVVTGSVTYLNLGQFNRTLNSPEVIETFNSYEFAITGGYATKIMDNLGIGINTRFIYSALAPFATAEEKGRGVGSAISFDVGVLYNVSAIPIPFSDFELKDFLNIGLNISNIGPSITYIDEKQADPLPMNFRLGFGFKIYQDQFNSLTAVTDFNKLLVKSDTAGNRDPYYKAFFTSWTDQSFERELATITSSIGVEYWYGDPKLIALRMGFFYEDPQFGNRKFLTFGAGIRYDIYGLDFSYISTFEEQHPLANTLRFTLLMSF
jgi:hypothetical protein